MKVELTWYEFGGCIDVARDRMLTSLAANWNDASTYRRSYLQRLTEEVVGACGERAYCKAQGNYWDGSVNTFHVEPDAARGVEIRTTTREDGSLIVRDNDADDRWFVLVTGTPPVMTVRDCILGVSAKRDEYLRDPHAHRPAWFVPQSALRPWAPKQVAA